jgi:hypothetical protein
MGIFDLQSRREKENNRNRFKGETDVGISKETRIR